MNIRVIVCKCLILMIIMLMLCACSQSGSGVSEERIYNAQPMEVYSDRAITIEASSAQIIEANGQKYSFVKMRVTNNGTESFAFSSKLCVEMTDSMGGICEIIPASVVLSDIPNCPTDYYPLDGLIKPGEPREGYLVFTAEQSEGALNVSFAVDYAENEWVKFTIS